MIKLVKICSLVGVGLGLTWGLMGCSDGGTVTTPAGGSDKPKVTVDPKSGNQMSEPAKPASE